MTSKRTQVHVTHRNEDKDWAVKLAGASRASKTFENKDEAISYAKERAKQENLSQVIIHKKEGNRIQTEYTYGKDPEKTAG